jgi:hypothetical protein
MMKKIIAKLAIIFMLATVFTGIGSVANASPAHAGTNLQCTQQDSGVWNGFWTPSGSGRYRAWCYTDYDWMEEVFLGYRDGWHTSAVSNTYCGGAIGLFVSHC